MPNMAGTIASFGKPVQRLGALDIDADVEKCGLKGSPTRVKKIFSPKVHSDVQFLGESVEEAASAAVHLFMDRGFMQSV
jgi:electron transfer flavoprotein beta subunit